MSPKLEKYHNWINKVYLKQNINYYYVLYVTLKNFYQNYKSNLSSFDKLYIMDYITFNKLMYDNNKYHYLTNFMSNYNKYNFNLKKKNIGQYLLNIDIVKLFCKVSQYLSMYNLNQIPSEKLIYLITNPSIIFNDSKNSSNIFIYHTIITIFDFISFGLLEYIGIDYILNNEYKNNKYHKLDKILYKYCDMKSKNILNITEYNFIKKMEFSYRNELNDYLLNHHLQEVKYDKDYQFYYSKYEFLLFYGNLNKWYSKPLKKNTYK